MSLQIPQSDRRGFLAAAAGLVAGPAAAAATAAQTDAGTAAPPTPAEWVAFVDYLLGLHAADRPDRPTGPTLERLAADPAWPMTALGLSPDPWQAACLADPFPRQLILASRRCGKSTVAAVRTLAHSLMNDNALSLVLSPTLRQSMEFARAVADADRAIGRPVPVVGDSATGVEWGNGSRMLSLPDNQRGVVGFSPTLIVIDEASRVSDILYKSLRPMLFRGAQLLLLSTPFGQRGFFFDIWDDPVRLNNFRWWRVTAERCPRLTAQFLAEERIELGERWYRQEYECNFSAAIDRVFSDEVIRAAFVGGIEPLFPIDPLAEDRR
jgi:hypothetical protein